MKTMSIPAAVLTAAFICLPGLVGGQDFLSDGLSGGSAAGSSAGLAAAGSPSSSSFADGTRAINEGRWEDAIAIFTKLADLKGDYADGALYWKAYAENKLGRSSQALDTCTALLRQYPASSWIEECGALKIEIHAANGQPLPPSAEQSDDLKLLALAALMHRDEKQGLAQIDEILNGDSSEKLKQGAIFIMREHHTGTVYPQIARVSLVDGDVRVARGKIKGRAKDWDWEQAVPNLPLETGYSLATGKGRAEIEFENDSTLYLGEDSVLLFNDLHTLAGVPYTEVALLSGTATLHVKPYVRGESFVLKTPTDMMITKYPNQANFRVSSYLDGVALTPLANAGVDLERSEERLVAGKTTYYKDGQPILDAGPIHPPDFTEWDNWVAARYAQRQKETVEALKASGLSSPIPGLAQMAQAGIFFPCEPYGTCWRPNPSQSQAPGDTPTPADAEPAKPTEQAQVSSSGTQTTDSASKIRFVGKPMANPPSPLLQPSPGLLDLAMDAFYPCMPNGLGFLTLMSLYPTAGLTFNPTYWYSLAPWSWAVCNSGSWIYINNGNGGGGYVWVVGKPHHHPPVRWIKTGHTVAFVPVHPYDIKDHLPVNRKNGAFAVNPKGVHPVEHVELNAGRKIELLSEPPQVFRTAFAPPLARAEAPHLMAHEMRDLSVAKNSPAQPAGTPITFDHKSQTFMMPHEVAQGGKSVTVLAPVGNRNGNLQTRAGYYGGGTSHGGSTTGGGSSAGGSRGGVSGGGGSASSSGGSYSGGGSVSSSSSGTSSSSSSAGSSSSSGGGGGHR